VQEEVGLKGARVAAFNIKPDYAFSLDVTLSGGEPGIKPQESDTKMGKGPAIIYAESGGAGLIANPKLNKFLIEIAKKENIPVQLEATSGGMTDAAIMYITGEGTPTASIGIPTRYIHTPVSVVDADDIEAAAKLLAKTIEKGIKL
jgi:endoglucanase